MITHMSRRNILDVIEDIKKVLSKREEMSVKRISEKVKSQTELLKTISESLR